MAGSRIPWRFLPFSRTATPVQAATYLLGIALFSISFLVFLNSAVSFVITDLLGVKTGVGDIVGTLGFVDEIVALVACPVWGLVSDRLGVRWVAVLGYGIIAVSLFCFVQARDVYPSLVLARIAFALGATAAATMVTAILPVLTNDEAAAADREDGYDALRGEETEDATSPGSAGSSHKSSHHQRDSVAMSLESDATITPEIFTQNLSRNRRESNNTEDSYGVYGGAEGKGARPSALAGYVGLFTGCGALVALSLFLPLPTRFSRKEGVTPAQAITHSFYVVGAVAIVVAVFVFFGLRGLHGEEEKGWRMLLGLRKQHDAVGPNGSSAGLSRVAHNRPLPYRKLLVSSLRLGVTDRHIAIAYLGGFVARASTVAISLFIPLYVNAFFISNGYCHGSPNDPSPDLKKECRAAYVLASILTGVAQLAGLLCAPIFGYASRKSNKVNIPLIFASLLGVVGWTAFPQLQSPEYANVSDRGGSPAVFLVVILVGISQIGAIVCSLGSIGRGVLTADVPIISTDEEGNAETDALLGPNAGGSSSSDAVPRRKEKALVSRVQLKGSIAGVYSWCGGAAILLLTKLGGYLFDVTSRGAPFYMMAIFNGVLFVASIAIGLVARRRP
ncbi:hypothetical protein F5Y11DRAFT_128101 [Daldinia sp. FL1419]|nr:hypothetical protein F5Y11DRAFT_128101 [Daldinia sp. FL1419]